MEGGGLIALAIRRPVAVLVLVILVVMFGLLSLRGLPIQLTPDLEIPTLTVTTRWPGAAPAEVEREIVDEQEEVLKSVEGLDRMTSESADGQGTVTLEFEVGTDIDQALVRVNNRLTQVPNYPDSAREPVISTANSAGPPLAVVLLRSKHGADVAEYRTWAANEILPELERIPGVASIRHFGGRDTEVEIAFEPAEMAARHITVADISRAVSAQLADVSAGDVDLSKRRYVVRTLVSPVAPADLERTVLRVGVDGQVVRLGDVARARTAIGKRNAYVFGDDREAMALLFDREAGSNVLEVTREVYAVVEALQRDKLDRLDLELKVVSDQIGYITAALALIRNNLVFGGMLAVAVLLVFLRSVRASTVIATAIPVCVIGAALGMSLLGRTVNVVSLAGMAFAVGMVVDNSIVVLEAIDTWRKKGLSAAEAALEGTREVWGAILAGTLTTVAVFLPIIGWRDEVGGLLRDVAVAISVSVLLSLAVSVIAIPSFSARLLANEAPSEGTSLSQRAGERVRDVVGRHAAWVSRGWFRGVAITGGAVTASVFVTWLLLPPLEYLPTGNRNQLFSVVVAPAGYSVEEMMSVGRRFQTELQPHVGVETGGVPGVFRSFFVARPGGGFQGATALDDGKIGDLVAYYRKKQSTIPGIFGFTSQASLFARNLGSSRAVDVELRGSDLGELISVGGPLLGAMSKAIPGAQIRPIPSLDLGAPELRVTPKLETATQLGMSASDVGAVVDALVDGRFVGEWAPPGQPQVDVVLRPIDGGARTPAELRASPVATPSGDVVPLSSLAAIDETVGPAVIQRIERRRAITLQVSPPDGVALQTAIDTIDGVVEGMRESGSIPERVDVQLSGTADKLADATSRMAGVLFLAVLISFLLMAALFEDFIAPIVILITVPLASAGGVVALRLVDTFLGKQPLDMMTALGFVILIGTVVNNAILVVDGALVRLREGMPVAEALGDSVHRRVRPIAMSTLTSLAGLLPLVLFPGSGSELYRGVGAIVLGGLALSTLLTLYVIPAAFSVTWRLLGRAT